MDPCGSASYQLPHYHLFNMFNREFPGTEPQALWQVYEVNLTMRGRGLVSREGVLGT